MLVDCWPLAHVLKGYNSRYVCLLYYHCELQYFFKKGFADRVVTWLEVFIKEIQDKMKAADEDLNNVNVVWDMQ